MGKTHIALVISNLEFGGAQRQLVELANNLPNDKFRVSVISLSKYIPLASFLMSDVVDLHVIEKKSKYDWSVAIRLSRLLRKKKVDLAHAFLFDAEIATRIACKIANVEAMIGSERNSNYRIKWNQRVAYRITKGMRKLCIANSRAGAEFNADILGYPVTHYRVIHNCVDLSRFHPKNGKIRREECGLKAGSFVIGMFASIKPQKNHPLLFRAVAISRALSRNCQILLVGDVLHGGAQKTDSYREDVIKQVEDAGLMPICRFLGNQSNVEDFYGLCDVTVLPSKFEGFPNAILESLACGIPVVATDVADNSLLIDHGVNGFLVPPDDVENLAFCLDKLASDEKLRSRMGREARIKAEQRFSPERFSQSVASVYLDLLASVGAT